MRAVWSLPALVAGCVCLLAGCGGGGGGGSSASNGSGNGGGSGGGNNGPSPPTLTLQANPASVVQGGSTTLTWSSPGADNCSASGGWSGLRASSGSETVTNLQSTATYAMRCSNSAGSADRSIEVQVAQTPIPTISFTATPALAERGSTVTLSWSATNATTCYTLWTPLYYEVPVQGSQQYAVRADHPSSRFSVSLRCSGPSGSSEETLIVPVKTFAGQLRVPAGVYTDADVNDPNASYASNDVNPQPIASFGFVPGYVNVAGQGPQGRSFASGDQWDYYYIDSDAPNQVIRLRLPTVDMNLPAAQRDDADLYLYSRSSGALVDASIGSGAEEVIELPSDDAFVIGVKAERGGFNYLLSIEDAPLVSSLGGARLSTEFVPGEAILTMQSVASQGFGSRKAGAPGREMLMQFSTDAPVASSTRNQKSARPSFSQKAESQMSAEMRSKLATLQEVKRLSQQPGVRSATVNRIVHAQLTPTDPLFARQRWHYESIQLPAAWDITTGSSDVIVAVIDSGAVLGHPELQSKFVDGYDMVGRDADVTDSGYQIGTERIYHGTHVMGTIGAVANNGNGGAGVAWGARIMPIRALDGRSGTAYNVMQSVRYAAGLPNDSGRLPARRADIINMSLGSDDSCTAGEAELFEQVAAAGIVVVASAGNSRSNVETSPATCPSVFGVIATGPGGNLAEYSNYGPRFSLAAPGGDMRFDADVDGFLDGIFSTAGTPGNGVIDPSYTYLQGTSMASPHVAGVFALMKSVRPSLTPLELRQLLEGGWITDEDPSNAPYYELSHGVINAYKAVRAAGNNMTPPPRVGATPGLLILDRGSESATFTLRNTGIGALTVGNVRGVAPWLTIVPESVTADGLGRYRVTANTTGLPRGTHNTSVEVQSSAGTMNIPVVVNKLLYGSASSLSKLYVRFSDGGSSAVVTTRAIDNRFGDISYRIDDLPFGTFVVTAGTDMNNDGNICDAGEVCGVYPIRGVPEAIEYSGVRDNVDIELSVTALRQQ